MMNEVWVVLVGVGGYGNYEKKTLLRGLLIIRLSKVALYDEDVWMKCCVG
jgi:hypothetical protein